MNAASARRIRSARPGRRPSGRPLRIVALGGGTGLPVVLRSLKRAVAEAGGTLTGIVTVTDDGGSSGRLRRAYDVLPMGDIRNCLVALSENEPLMSRLFQYRYRGRDGLGGHTVGNLILTALADSTRSYLRAIETSGQVLAIRGRILPATLANVALVARCADGRLLRGETRVSQSHAPITRVTTDPPHPAPAPGVLAALREADLIILGPGSLFTSVVPNLLVRGVARLIARSRAPRVLVGNLMTQPGETDDFTAAAHLAALTRLAGVRLVDYYLSNSRAIAPSLRRRYAADGAIPVEMDRAALRAMGAAPVERDLLREDGDAKIRHHEGKLGRALLRLALARPSRAAA
ncbi:MAG TPA: uridine diphosphate-N-acetylglucosamine-binding protein YvcK [Candidatus Polarisedimenticolia bacterium]|nr:uridine diphosphate-N-acetylglucosamine-binding protein YvcK [Candidatus Polarisedimenticolia bacterium]